MLLSSRQTFTSSEVGTARQMLILQSHLIGSNQRAGWSWRKPQDSEGFTSRCNGLSPQFQVRDADLVRRADYRQDALTVKCSKDHSRFFSQQFPPLVDGASGTEEKICRQIPKQTVTRRYVLVIVATACL